VRRALAAAAGAGAALAAWALYESQWVECRRLDVPVCELPEALAGLTILHLSDFHVGMPSLAARALRKAVDYGVRARPDLVVITGDLVTHPRGERHVLEQLARLEAPLGVFAVLGNHDHGETRDPFSRRHEIRDWGETTLLRDESVLLRTAAGGELELAGIDAGSWLEGHADPVALLHHGEAFSVVLCHFPDAVELVPAERRALVLAGHLHGGQICLPDPREPRRRVRFSKLDARYPEGVFRLGRRTLVVSRGIGTTLVPFRLLSRPEAALLHLLPATAA
jgi:uncharacterized protein